MTNPAPETPTPEPSAPLPPKQARELSRTTSPVVLKPAAVPKWRRLWRGATSSLTLPVFPLGRLASGTWVSRREGERLRHGLVLVLPGIESQSFLNIGILMGLVDGGVTAAVEIFDWTTGHNPLFLYHLRASRRNRRIAKSLANIIVNYQDEYPGRPVILIGHSGGGGMSLLTLEELPEGRKITAAILLAPAVSPTYPLDKARRRVTHGMWNYYSYLDCLLLGIGTVVAGTFDGHHNVCAGMVGFTAEGEAHDGQALLRQVPYQLKFLRWFNIGGHFGVSNRLFVAEEIAPLVVDLERTVNEPPPGSGGTP